MLYRWPQGRIMRVFPVAVVFIAADLGFNAYGQYDAGARLKTRMSPTCTWAFWVLVRWISLVV